MTMVGMRHLAEERVCETERVRCRPVVDRHAERDLAIVLAITASC